MTAAEFGSTSFQTKSSQTPMSPALRSKAKEREKGKGKGIGMGEGKGKSSEANDSGCSMTVSGEPHSWGWSAPMANQWPDPPVITLTGRRGGEALPGGSSSDLGLMNTSLKLEDEPSQVQV